MTDLSSSSDSRPPRGEAGRRRPRHRRAHRARRPPARRHPRRARRHPPQLEADGPPRPGDAPPRGARRHDRARRLHPRRRIPAARLPQPRRSARERPHPAASRAARSAVRRDDPLRRPLRQGHRLPGQDGSPAGRRPAHVGGRRSQPGVPDRGRQGAPEQSAPRPSAGHRLVRRVPPRAEDAEHPGHRRGASRRARGDPARAASASTTRRTRSASTASPSRSTSTAPPPPPAPSASAPSPSAARWSASSTPFPTSARRSHGCWGPTRSDSPGRAPPRGGARRRRAVPQLSSSVVDSMICRMTSIEISWRSPSTHS